MMRQVNVLLADVYAEVLRELVKEGEYPSIAAAGRLAVWKMIKNENRRFSGSEIVYVPLSKRSYDMLR
jgi:Arc/MetJ-type ribon-helix-helix transcriptional regulator